MNFHQQSPFCLNVIHKLWAITKLSSTSNVTHLHFIRNWVHIQIRVFIKTYDVMIWLSNEHRDNDNIIELSWFLIKSRWIRVTDRYISKYKTSLYYYSYGLYWILSTIGWFWVKTTHRSNLWLLRLQLTWANSRWKRKVLRNDTMVELGLYSVKW